MRSLFSKLSLVALAAVAMALFLLAPSQHVTEAHHELPGADGNTSACGNMPTTEPCVVDYIRVDTDPEVGTGNENTGSVLPLGAFDECREVASSAVFESDIVVAHLPDIDGTVSTGNDASGDDASTADGASLIQVIVAYDNDKLTLGTVRQWLVTVGTPTLLGVDPDSAVGLAGNAIVNELDAGAGTDPRIVMVLMSASPENADATEDGIGGTFARLPFTAIADGFAEVSVLGSYDINSTKVIDTNNDVFTIGEHISGSVYSADGLYGADGETGGTASADDQAATSYIAIGGGSYVCGGASDVTVTKSAPAIEDVQANDCASGAQTPPIAGASDAGLCLRTETLTVTATATLTDSGDPSEVNLAATVSGLTGDCTPSAVTFSGDATGTSPQVVSMAGGGDTKVVTETVTLTCTARGEKDITIDNHLTFVNPTQTGTLTDDSVSINDFEVYQIVDTSVSAFAPTSADFGLDSLGCTTDGTGVGANVTYTANTVTDTGASFPVTSAALDAAVVDSPSAGVTTLVDADVFNTGDLAGQVIAMTSGAASGESQIIRVHDTGSAAVIVQNFSAAPVATDTYTIQSLAGKAVTASDATAGLITRTIVSHTATTLTVTPDWDAIPGSKGVAGIPADYTSPYAAAHATGAGAGLPLPEADDANADVGNTLCSSLALSEVAGGNMSNDLPRVTTRDTGSPTTPLAFTKSVTGATPTVATLDHVSVSLPDLDGAAGVQSVIDFSAGGIPVTVTGKSGICDVDTSPQTQLAVLDASPSISVTDQQVHCTEGSFIDSNLSGGNNLRLQMLAIVDILDMDGNVANGIQFTPDGSTLDPYAVDADPSNNIAQIQNFDLGGGNYAYGLWSLPKFEPEYRSVIGQTLTLPLVTGVPGQQNPANTDQCVTGAPCATGTYYAVGDSTLGWASGVDNDFDTVADEVEDYQPLAGSIVITPADWLVQTGVDANTYSGGSIPLPGVPGTGTPVGEFRANVVAAAPDCKTGQIGVPVPPTGTAGLSDAAMPLTQAWAADPAAAVLEAAAAAEGTAEFGMWTGEHAGNPTTTGGKLTGFDFTATGTSVMPSAGDWDGHQLLLTFTSGPSTGTARVIDSNTASNLQISTVAPSEGFTSPYSAIGDTFTITAIVSPTLFPTTLMLDAQIAGMIGGIDGDPATDDGPPMWYRYVGIADTKAANDTLTPVNAVAFNAGEKGYLSVISTDDPGLVLPGTTATCTPFVSESKIAALVLGAIPMRVATADGPQVFYDQFVRADTGGKILFVDTSQASSETNIELTAVDVDAAVTVATDLSASVEPPPEDPDADDDPVVGVPDGDDTGPDRRVKVTVTNGVGTIGATGVDVELIAVSGKIINNPVDPNDDVDCTVRWDLEGYDITNAAVNDPSLVQRLTVGDIDLDREKYNTGAMAPATTHEQWVSYDVTCTGNNAMVGANLPQVTAVASIAPGGPPEPSVPGTTDNSAANTTEVTLTDNADGDALINSADNCPFTVNDDQRNADANDPANGNDQTGNACDTDDDNDTVLDTAEGLSTCSPGIPGANRAALSAATLLTYQEDPDGVADTDGCRDVDLGIEYSGTSGDVDTDTPTDIGPVTATVENFDQYISANGTLTTSIISRSLLPGEGSNPTSDDEGCQVDIEGAGFTQEFDIDSDGDLDHQSIRTDLIALPSGGKTGVDAPAIVFDATVTCPDKSSHTMTLNGSTSVVSPIVDSTPANDADAHDVIADAYGKADLRVSKGSVTAPAGGLYTPGTPFVISMPATVRNNGPDGTDGAYAVLSASGASSDANCTGMATPSVSPDAGPYDIAAATQTTNTESVTITCTAAAADSVTFTLTDTVSLLAGSYLIDPNATNDSAVKSVTLQKDSDGDGVVDPSDNCPAVANPTQTDSDGDGEGDACDATPTHDVAASNLVAPTSHNASTYVTTTFQVTAKATNNSGHTEEVTLALDIDDTMIPGGCTASAVLQVPGSATQTLTAAQVLDVTYQVSLSGCSSAPDLGSIEVTFSVTHVNVGGTHGDETAVADNSQSQTVTINVPY